MGSQDQKRQAMLSGDWAMTQAADPSGSQELPEHPDYPRILAVFNDAAGPLRARGLLNRRDLCTDTSLTHA
ncbi:hypothetical protein GT018_17465 [Streptomyces sp. SID4912]|uniref:hypothetical protein n=2 Tax=Streptomyces TaxID=1883 RepID=UPI00081B2AE6|nr:MULTISPECIES: hypothetical protein [unclassified Streptomyces]MYY17395.1 hypothetical protein [Streptomyces sp. SID4912]SCD27040.1 hypothetical protein GA0115241_100232 [Streptomyces sp. DpondAA-D4]